MEAEKRILSAYQISVVNFNKITDSLFRIDDGQQSYALKRSTLTRATIDSWEAVFHKANDENLFEIIPIILTRNNKVYSEFNGVYYYLTPWIKVNESSIEQLYRSIGNIHKKTNQTKLINHTDVVSQFNVYKDHCTQGMRDLLTYVDLFEQVRYMSPFELQVCTHFRDVEMAIEQTVHMIEKFIVELAEEKTWNYSLCHGCLKRSHVLGQTVINWEKAKYDHPITDLVAFFNSEVAFYDAPNKRIIDLFTIYLDRNELTKAELYLLTIYLMDPIKYLSYVEQYLNDKNHVSMIERVKNLQPLYRNLVFGLQWFKFIEEKFSSPIFEEN